MIRAHEACVQHMYARDTWHLLNVGDIHDMMHAQQTHEGKVADVLRGQLAQGLSAQPPAPPVLVQSRLPPYLQEMHAPQHVA